MHDVEKVKDFAPGESKVNLLNRYEQTVLLDFMLYRMDSKLRGEMMKAFPVIYNRLCQKEIVRVVKRADEVTA